MTQLTLTTPTQEEINNACWRACDSFRGVVDSSEYKNYILVMLFVKYISDVWDARRAELKARYGDSPEMIARQLKYERFQLTEEATFDYLYARRSADNIGELIDIALEQIEERNRQKLEGVFRNTSFNRDIIGVPRERNARLKHLLEDLEPLHLAGVRQDLIGGAYMYLISRFAGDAGKKGGEFYTPDQVSRLLGKLLRARPGDRISDPACGSGSLLLRVADEIPEHERHNYSLFGQEANGGTWALCRMNMVLHDEDSADIRWGDTLRNPLLLEDDRLMQFDIVVANPPFSLDKWGIEADAVASDPYHRFRRGLPPKSKADYAFLSHMVATARPQAGRVGVIVPHGVLFRGGAEGRIRQSLIDDNLLDAVIGLPENLFFGTGIPAAILIFDRSREAGGDRAAEDTVLFVDAGRLKQPGKNQNTLRDDDIEEIAATYHARAEKERFSRRVNRAEILGNDYNLNIPRYVDTSVAAPAVDIAALRHEIAGLEDQLAAVRSRLAAHLRELELA